MGFLFLHLPRWRLGDQITLNERERGASERYENWSSDVSKISLFFNFQSHCQILYILACLSKFLEPRLRATSFDVAPSALYLSIRTSLSATETPWTSWSLSAWCVLSGVWDTEWYCAIHFFLNAIDAITNSFFTITLSWFL